LRHFSNTDIRHFAAAHNDNNIAPGAPTTAKFAVKIDF